MNEQEFQEMEERDKRISTGENVYHSSSSPWICAIYDRRLLLTEVKRLKAHRVVGVDEVLPLFEFSCQDDWPTVFKQIVEYMETHCLSIGAADRLRDRVDAIWNLVQGRM